MERRWIYWNTDWSMTILKCSIWMRTVQCWVLPPNRQKGAEIQTITKESGAEKAGLKKGDIIKKIDDKKIESPDDLTEAIQDT